jgi:uncharacterized protein (DUF1330 family)
MTLKSTFKLALLSLLLNSSGVLAADNLGANAQESGEVEGLAFLAQSDMEGPVTLVDFVKFKPGGEETYDRYDALAEEKLRALGGEVIFRGYSSPFFDGSANEREAARHGADPSDLGWDRVTMRKYPSASAVVEMGASDEYQAALPNRAEAIEDSVVYAFGGNQMRNVPLSESPDTIYMLNLLRFNGDGGVAGYGDYGSSVVPLIQGAGGAPMLSARGITPIISNQEIDSMILVAYPSHEAFLSMLRSDAYRTISSKRTNSIELGLNFPFSDRK